MKLLLDLGNSRLKWALSAAGTWHSGAVAGNDHTLFEGLLQAIRMPRDIEAVWLASVRSGPESDRLAARLAETFGLPIGRPASEARRGALCNAYAEPGRLGVDRWLAMLAAWSPGQAVLVADAGTGLTLDAVDSTGRHLGGMILPGPMTLGESLLRRATHLPSPRLDPEAALTQPWAQETALALGNGALWACAALLDRMSAELSARTGALRLVLTGGNAELLLPLLDAQADHDPDLVLRGLARYAEG